MADPRRPAAMGAASRGRVEAYFGLASTARATLDFYRHLVRPRPGTDH